MMTLQQNLVILTFSLVFFTSVLCGVHDNTVQECNLPENLVQEIQSYAPVVNQIINAATNGSFKGVTFNELADFVDKFGSRLAGTRNLENAIDYMLNKSVAEGLDNVHGEEVTVPHWVRGQESAVVISPRQQPLAILGLGNSVGTPAEGLFAPVLVVRTFDELKQKADLAKGRIVVYNQDYISYGKSVAYRGQGATEAAKVGAVASLIRSVTPYSMNTPHTGSQTYRDNVTKIPTACISVEDAHFLQRLQDRGENITILLKMEAHNLPETVSRNTVVDLKGSKTPEKHVIVSGHIDSWDVGSGAMDDGGGVFISWGSLVLLKKLELKPKRTIRAVLWTAEEPGLIGAAAYEKAHRNESDNLVFIMESDIGTFTPLGLEYSAGPKGGCIIQEIMKLLAPINATQAVSSSDVGSDITLWTGNGFPGGSLYTQNERYFWYHHSNADTLDVENSGDLDKNTALWASVAYIIADLEDDFPREPNEQPTKKNKAWKKALLNN